MREDIEAEIAKLRRDLDALPAPRLTPTTVPVGPTSTPVPPPPPRSTPIYKRWWFWTLIGAAVAGATAGAVAGTTHRSGPAVNYRQEIP
jgi:hypothetical protein